MNSPDPITRLNAALEGRYSTMNAMTESTVRLSTALADRYRIERQLGKGGMLSVC